MILLRIFVNLYFKSQRYLLYPVAILRRNGFALVMLLGLLYVFHLFTRKEEVPVIQYNGARSGITTPAPQPNAAPAAATATTPPAPANTTTPAEADGKPATTGAASATAPAAATPPLPPLPMTKDGKIPKNLKVDIIKKVENGNSVFSSDPLDSMSKQELMNYSQVFYWAMDNLADGASHEWAFYNTNGTITPLSSFDNNHGRSCRRFKEVLKVHEVQQNISGVACPQDEGGWCKLRNNSTPACGLGRKGGIGSWWQDTKYGVMNLFH